MIMTVDEAIKIALVEVKDPYAKVYLDAIPKAIETFGIAGLTSQLLYAMANMRSWRGENARTAKSVFTKFIKAHQNDDQNQTQIKTC
jgi:hypothetical protein